MSPSDMMQPQEPHTCKRSSALLEALRRRMDPSGRQLAADICHMWSKGPAKQSQRTPTLPGAFSRPVGRICHQEEQAQPPLSVIGRDPLMRRGANRGPASTTERKWLWQPYLKIMAGLTPYTFYVACHTLHVVYSTHKHIVCCKHHVLYAYIRSYAIQMCSMILYIIPYTLYII